MLPLIRKFSSTTLALLAFILAAIVMVSVAYGTALVIESRSRHAVEARLADQGIDWITVRTDGLQVQLSGTAPNEAARFRAVNLVGAIIDSSRIRDGLDVAPASAIKAPDFSVQMLRTEDGVQLIGLMPLKAAEGALSVTKPVIARYFVEHIVPEARGLKAAATAGADLLYALDAAALAG